MYFWRLPQVFSAHDRNRVGHSPNRPSLYPVSEDAHQYPEKPEDLPILQKAYEPLVSSVVAEIDDGRSDVAGQVYGCKD